MIGAPILAVIDARMGEIYAGVFRRTPTGSSSRSARSRSDRQELVLPAA